MQKVYGYRFAAEQLTALRGKQQQIEVAAAIDASPSLISQLESGQIPTPSVDTVARLSQYFQVPMEVFVEPVHAKPKKNSKPISVPRRQKDNVMVAVPRQNVPAVRSLLRSLER